MSEAAEESLDLEMIRRNNEHNILGMFIAQFQQQIEQETDPEEKKKKQMALEAGVKALLNSAGNSL